MFKDVEARKSVVISSHYSYALNKEHEGGEMREEGGEVNRGFHAREKRVWTLYKKKKKECKPIKHSKQKNNVAKIIYEKELSDISVEK